MNVGAVGPGPQEENEVDHVRDEGVGHVSEEGESKFFSRVANDHVM